jgi:hypothetical protein
MHCKVVFFFGDLLSLCFLVRLFIWIKFSFGMQSVGASAIAGHVYAGIIACPSENQVCDNCIQTLQKSPVCASCSQKFQVFSTQPA